MVRLSPQSITYRRWTAAEEEEPGDDAHAAIANSDALRRSRIVRMRASDRPASRSWGDYAPHVVN
jgi:hypothetical protein